MWCCVPRPRRATVTCEHVYRITSLVNVVDGDTVDVVLDLGFSVSTRQRVRLLGIDTPESRTTDKEEKKYGLLAKKTLAEWCARATELELRCPKRDSREKFGRVLGELWMREGDGPWVNAGQRLVDEGHAVPYDGQNKRNVERLHMLNRKKLALRE